MKWCHTRLHVWPIVKSINIIITILYWRFNGPSRQHFKPFSLWLSLLIFVTFPERYIWNILISISLSEVEKLTPSYISEVAKVNIMSSDSQPRAVFPYQGMLKYVDHSLLNKHVLNCYYMLGTALGTQSAVVGKKYKFFCSPSQHTSVKRQSVNN